MQEGLKAIYYDNLASSINQETSLDLLHQISPRPHLRKHLRQYDCYMVIQLRKNCSMLNFLPLTKKEREWTRMKTIAMMQNHGTRHPISPMLIINQRKPSFSYLLTVSNQCYNIKTSDCILHDCILHIRSTCRIPSDEACLGNGLSRYLAQRFFPLYISQVHSFSHLMRISDVFA